MMNKRGLSEVVVSVLLVVLAIAAIVIVWTAIKPMIKQGASSASDLSLTINMEIISAQFATATNTTTVKIKRDAGAGTVDKIKVVLTNDKESASGLIEDSLDELETQTFDVVISIKDPEKIDIYPVTIGDDGKEKIGTIADSAVITIVA